MNRFLCVIENSYCYSESSIGSCGDPVDHCLGKVNSFECYKDECFHYSKDLKECNHPLNSNKKGKDYVN